MKEDTVVSKEDFVAYVKVQKSGVTNMFAVNKVCELSGLTKTQVFEIMKNYTNFEHAYKLN